MKTLQMFLLLMNSSEDVVTLCFGKFMEWQSSLQMCFRFHFIRNLVCLQSGRFETHTKVCLSISSFHEESWQPSWSMRTALTALIAFFPTNGKVMLLSILTVSAHLRPSCMYMRYENGMVSCFHLLVLCRVQWRQWTRQRLSEFRWQRNLGVIFLSHKYNCVVHFLLRIQWMVLWLHYRFDTAGNCRHKIPQGSSTEKQEVMRRLHAFLLAQDSTESAPASVCGPETPEPGQSSTSSTQAASDESTDLICDSGQECLTSDIPACEQKAHRRILESPPPASSSSCSAPRPVNQAGTVPAHSSGVQVLLQKCIKALDTILLSLLMVLGVIAAWRCSR